MVNRYFVCVLSFLLFVTACGDNGINKGALKTPINSKPGWNAELIETLIACQPNPGPLCDCVIPKVTEKYTPEQVKEKSPYVAADMLAIRGKCDASDTPGSANPAEPANPQMYGYQSLAGEQCETGAHTFSSFVAMCEGLQSESLNQNCALKERQNIFEKLVCPGTFKKMP